MRGDPIIRPASTLAYDRSGLIMGDRHPGLVEPNAEQREQQPEIEPEWFRSPSPSAETLEGLAAELSDLLWKRQEPVLEWLPSSTWHRSSARNTGLWRDQLLAEIEDLAGELNRKVARYASIRAAQSSDPAEGPADAAAVAWVHQTLEDIAATALGMEIASREAFLRARMAQAHRLNVEAAHERKTGTAD